MEPHSGECPLSRGVGMSRKAVESQFLPECAGRKGTGLLDRLNGIDHV